MRYFILDEEDRRKISLEPDFILLSAADFKGSPNEDEDDTEQKEYIVNHSSDRMLLDKKKGYVVAPILYQSERYLGIFSEESWEKSLNEMKDISSLQAKKLTRFILSNAELMEQSETIETFTFSMHSLYFIGCTEYPDELLGYQVGEGVFVLRRR